MTQEPTSENQEDNAVEEVSSDKAFEVEINLIRDEITRRMEFNRRIQNFQITLIGLILVTYATKLADFTYVIFDAACVAIITVNSIFLLEIRQNNYYNMLAALYIRDVLVKKYKTKKNNAVIGWEDFLNKRRAAGKSIFEKRSFILDGHLLMSIYLLILPTLAYIISITRAGISGPDYIFIPLMAFSLTISFMTIYRYINDGHTIVSETK